MMRWKSWPAAVDIHQQPLLEGLLCCGNGALPATVLTGISGMMWDHSSQTDILSELALKKKKKSGGCGGDLDVVISQDITWKL